MPLWVASSDVLGRILPCLQRLDQLKHGQAGTPEGGEDFKRQISNARLELPGLGIFEAGVGIRQCLYLEKPDTALD